jgi:aminoglycoside 2'-N-acetyltransferase I
MNEIKIYTEKELPHALKYEIISLLDTIWPEPANETQNIEKSIHDLSLDPICVMLLSKEGKILSYAAILSKSISHEGNTYQAAGLSCVATQPNQRYFGYGKKVVKVATKIINENKSIDLGLFTCDHNLIPFYSQCGWKILKNSFLIGGSREEPFPSDVLGKTTLIRLLSNKAKENAVDFSKSPIYLELRKGDLW